VRIASHETVDRFGNRPDRHDRVGSNAATVVPSAHRERYAVEQQREHGRADGHRIGQIVTGERSVSELGGPVKMAKFSGEQLALGPLDFIEFVAFVSINLAFINLLPIPALDGGHLAFYAAEAVRRKPLGPRSQEWAFRTGIAFVLGLMLFVTINDVASLPLFGG
jgi:regulator of sigma E protease